MFCVTPFFNALAKMEVPLDDCHLIIFDNTDMPMLLKMLMDVGRQLKTRFYTLRLYKSWRQGGMVTMLDEQRGIKKINKPTRIPFIIEGYKDILNMTTTDLLINIEDDTLAPPHTIMKLLDNYESLGPNVFIGGVEPNRMGVGTEKPRLGAHYFYVDDGALLQRVSPSSICRGIKKVDATGHYCFITEKKTFLRGMEDMPVFINNPSQISFDGYHTYNLTRNNIPVYVDFDIRCEHMHTTPDRIIYAKVHNATPQVDYYIPQYRSWAIGVQLKEDILDRPDFDKWRIPSKKCLRCPKKN